MSTPATIVMTGATGGLGSVTAGLLTADPQTRLIVGARGSGRVVPGAQVLPLDLLSQESVREFAAAVLEELGGTPIDALVLNAGLQHRDLQHRSPEGFEATFAANHLAHYLLARLLVPHLTDGGLLLFTTSDTHDPSIIPFGPRTLDPQALAHPLRGGAIAGFQAYPASKLANLLTARSFAAREEVTSRGIRVVAYNPGLTLGTSLMGSGAPSRIATRALRPVLEAVSKVRPQFHPGTSERAGEALRELVVGAAVPPAGRVYASLVQGVITYPDPSELAQNDVVRDRLWNESAPMVGLDAD